MSTTGKTPVSLLSEMLVQKRIQPIYNLLMSGAGTNQGLFIYEVTAGDFLKARGHGRSKKEAKQDAAKSALQVLKESAGGRQELCEDILPIPSVEVISPYQEQLRENAVGSLNELCAISQLPVPAYHLIREDGPPHAKLFEIACKVSSFERCAIGRTKQQGKQMAAKLMLETLESLKLTGIPEPDIPLDKSAGTLEEREELMAEIRAERIARGLVTKPVARSLLGQHMGARLKHDWTVEKLAQVKELRVPTSTYFAQLQKICNELDLKLSSCVIRSDPPAIKIVVLTLSTQPELSFIGKATSAEACENKAASRALRFFDIMVWH